MFPGMTGSAFVIILIFTNIASQQEFSGGYRQDGNLYYTQTWTMKPNGIFKTLTVYNVIVINRVNCEHYLRAISIVEAVLFLDYFLLHFVSFIYSE